MSEREILPRATDETAHDSAAHDTAVRDGAARNGRADSSTRRSPLDPLFGVRAADIEPYTGLRYLSKLFRMIAIVLVLMLVAEVVTGLARQGLDSVPTLVSEVSRLIVLAGLLWGVGDLAVLLVDVGHDVRAVRILLARQTAHGMFAPITGPQPTPPRRATPSAPAPTPEIADLPPGDRRA